jgi:hypothetical protein
MSGVSSRRRMRRNNESKNQGEEQGKPEREQHRHYLQDNIIKAIDMSLVRKLMKYLKLRCVCPKSYNNSLDIQLCENCICVSKLLNAIALLESANISVSDRIEKDYFARYNGRTIQFRKDLQQFIDSMIAIIRKAAREKNNNNT